MRVLVTGSLGYIGTVLTGMLVKQGHDVSGLDSDLYELCTYTGTISDVPTVKKDSRDVEEHDLEGFEAVIHLAGLSNDPLGDFRPNLTEEINERASVRIAKLAKRVGISRFLFASSCSNYGAAGNDFLTEEAAFNPVTPYGRSKVAVEREVSKLADDKFHPTYLRASTAFGVSPRIRFDLVTNNLTAWACTTGKVRLKSDGLAWRPIVHVEDISRAYVAALQAPLELVHNEAFNVGTTAENYQVRDIANLVHELVPDCEVSFSPDASPDIRCYRVDCNKICRVLRDYKPQWTARQGVEQLRDTFMETGLRVEDFEGPRYRRISHIKEQISQGRLDNDLRWADAKDTKEGQQ